MEIRLLDKKDDFLQLRTEWSALWRQTGGNIFISWEWMYNWWDIFARPGDSLRLYCGYKSGRLVCIAPLFLQRGFWRKLRFLGSGIACPDYLSFICDKNAQKEFQEGLFKALLDKGSSWDCLVLDGMLESDCIKIEQALPRRISAKRLREHLCYYLDISNVKQTSQFVDDKFKKRIEASRRRILRDGKYEWKECDCQQENLEKLFPVFVGMHQKRWKKTEGVSAGLFSNPRFHAFHKRIAGEFCRQGWLSLVLLYLDDVAIAGLYNFKFNNKVYCYLTGFNHDYGVYSPGLLCLAESIERYKLQGMEEYDLLRGSEDYKKKWKTDTRQEYDLVLYKKDLKGLLMMFISLVYDQAKKTAKACLPDIMVMLRTIKNKNKH